MDHTSSRLHLSLGFHVLAVLAVLIGLVATTVAMSAPSTNDTSALRTAHGRIVVSNGVYQGRDRERILDDTEAKALADYFELLRLTVNPYLGRIPDEQRTRGYSQMPICIAMAHLSAAEQDQVLTPATPRQPRRNWLGAGLNEFEIKQAQKIYSDALYPRLLARAPKLPMQFVMVASVRIQAYDTERGGFPIQRMLQSMRSQPSVFFTLPKGNCFNLPQEYVFFGTQLPEFWPINATAAEAFIARMPVQNELPGLNTGQRQRDIYAAINFTLSTAPLVTFPNNSAWKKGQVPLTIDIESVALYEDVNLQRELHTFESLVRPAPAVLVAGLPDQVPRRDVVLLDDESTTLLALKQAGDVLSDDAWQVLARRQSTSDWQYHNQVRSSMFSGRGHSERFEGFEPDYVPFFPMGMEVVSQQTINPEQLQRFKQWAQMRASVLPDQMWLRGQLTRQTNLVEEFTLALDNAGGVVTKQQQATLSERGHELERMFSLRLTTERDFLRGVNKPRHVYFVLPQPLERFNPGLTPRQLEELGGLDQRHWSADVLVDVGKLQWIRDVENAGDNNRGPGDVLLVPLSPRSLTVLQLKPTGPRQQKFVVTTIHEHQYDLAGMQAQLDARLQSQADAQAAERSAQQDAAEQASANARSFANADILGLRRGMSVAEAQQIINDRLDVGWIARPVMARSYHQENNPYAEFITYISRDGAQQVVLFVHEALSDTVVAIGRDVIMPLNSDRDTITAQLRSKYGNEPLSVGNELIWSTAINKNGSRLARGCGSQTGNVDIETLRGDDGVDFTYAEHEAQIKAVTPFVIVYGGQVKDRQTRKRTWDTSAWKDCSPVVLATIKEGGNFLHLRVIVHDLSSYGDVYARWINAQKNADTTVVPDL